MEIEMVMDAWNKSCSQRRRVFVTDPQTPRRTASANLAGNCRIGADKAIQVLDDMIFSLEARINVSGGKDE